MSALDEFTEAQRRIIVAEIARHRKAAFDDGYRLGMGEGQAATVADWLRGAVRSKTMATGVGGLVASLFAYALPVVEELFKTANLDPKTAAIFSTTMIILRLLTTKPVARK